jgi:PAS domain S-box-containing protein
MPTNDRRAAAPALLAAVVGTAMDAIIAIDPEQKIVLFNPAAEKMFRCPASDAIGSPLNRFIPRRYRTLHHRDVEKFVATGSTSRAMGHLRPLSALRADGDEFPIEATISQVTIDGEMYGGAIVRDISERQAAESELRRQADLLDLAYDAIFTWEWGGPITFWNRGAERLYGYSREEAIGRISRDLLKTRRPGEADEIYDALEREGIWEGELIHTRKDGNEVVVESRHVLVRDDLHLYVLEANRDVTERKRIEAEQAAISARETAARAEADAAAAQRDRLRDILEGMPGGVEILAAPDAKLEFASGGLIELIFGAGLQFGTMPAYGRDFALFRADGTPLAPGERPALRALAGERVHNQQLELQRADGSRLPVVAHAAPLRDPDGRISHSIVVLQDVTQVRQAEQLKDDFLALISHEFRTPLTAIHGGAHLLAHDAGALDEETRQELLADVVAESERLDWMLGNLLTLTNVLAGRLRVATEPALIAPIARKAAAEVGRRSQRHRFVVDVSPEIPPVEADPDLLEQVLRNLYENAIKYAPDGGEVRTTAERVADRIAIRVMDQGIGIAPEHVRTVFERFRRVGGDSTVRGMGLGLYLSRGLVEAQGGTISADSAGLGQGATFTITLPVAQGWEELEAADELL